MIFVHCTFKRPTCLLARKIWIKLIYHIDCLCQSFPIVDSIQSRNDLTHKRLVFFLDRRLSSTQLANSTSILFVSFDVLPHPYMGITGNYLDFIRVILFYLFCRRSKRIIITAIFCYMLYIYISSH